MTMGEYIKQLRTERGLSQEELGKAVGVNRAAVNKWENGSVENIKRSTIKKLSQFFGVSPCDLMRWDDDNTVTKIQTEIEVCELFEQCYGKEAYTAVSKFLKLDAADRTLISSMMDTMLNQDKYSIQEESKHA